MSRERRINELNKTMCSLYESAGRISYVLSKHTDGGTSHTTITLRNDLKKIHEEIDKCGRELGLLLLEKQ